MLAIIFVAACCSSFRTLVLIATITTLGNSFFFQLEISRLKSYIPGKNPS